jgi:xanthine dehydrogenase YagR molybdenum-binding subunit
MASYIGTPTSRIDGHAKVTGGAKYAAEFNVPDLAHASVVCSTIAKGSIARVDTSEAMRVEGVIDVLTCQNRPPMARADSAYRDDVGPEDGSPFRPLYDDKIMFSRQPIALVVAEEPEVARFAASLVRVDYNEDEHLTDLFRRNKIVTLKAPAPPRGNAGKAYAASDVRHEAECHPDRTSQSDGAFRLDRDLGGRQAYGLRQDARRAERAALSLQCLRHETE